MITLFLLHDPKRLGIPEDLGLPVAGAVVIAVQAASAFQARSATRFGFMTTPERPAAIWTVFVLTFGLTWGLWAIVLWIGDKTSCIERFADCGFRVRPRHRSFCDRLEI